MFDKDLVIAAWPTLTELERNAVTQKVQTGRLYKQIAADLGGNEGTVKRAAVRAMNKLGIHGLVALVRAVDFVTGASSNG